MSEVTAQWQGLEGLLRELRELPQRLQTKVLTGAAAKGAAVIKDEVVRLAPMYVGFDINTGKYHSVGKNHPPAGTLKKAIYVAKLVNKSTPSEVVFRVGVRTGKIKGNGKANPHDAYYARWVEYGHFTATPRSLPGTLRQRRELARTTAKVRWVPPQPFFRPAYETKKGEAVQAMRDYIALNVPVLVAGMRYLKAA